MSDAIKIASLVAQQKNLTLAWLLPLLFGFLGVFYASVKGGLIMLGIYILLIVLMVVFSALAATFPPFVAIVILLFGAIFALWIYSIYYSYVTVKKHNMAIYQKAVELDAQGQLEE